MFQSGRKVLLITAFSFSAGFLLYPYFFPEKPASASDFKTPLSINMDSIGAEKKIATAEKIEAAPSGRSEFNIAFVAMIPGSLFWTWV